MDRDGAAVAVPSVVCLHGHRPMIGSMALLARALRRAGFRTVSPRYDSMRRALPDIVHAVLPVVSAFANGTNGSLHFVGHSLGGLVIRALLARWRPPILGRAVMIGTPQGGSEWADLCVRLRIDSHFLGPVRPYLITQRRETDEALLGRVDYPVGVIAGRTPFLPVIPPLLTRPNDGTVSVAATHLAGQADHIVLPVTHAVMPANRAVQRQTIAFLRNGRFDR